MGTYRATMTSASSYTCGDAEVITSKNNETFEKTWWKIDLCILPIIVLLSMLSFLVLVNIGNARIAGLQKDLEMTDSQFSTMATMNIVPHIIVLLPSNLALKAVGPNIVIATLMTLRGIVMTLQGIVRNYSELLACRFLLGLLEGSSFSSIVLYLSLWYPRQQLQQRMAVISGSGSLAVAFGGLLAYEIIRMDGIGERAGWSWIFILEGLFLFVLGFLSYFVLPASPGRARFLTEREKTYVITRLAESGATSRDEQSDEFSWCEVWKTFTLPHVWIHTIIFFFKGATFFGINIFTPTIVSELGYSNENAQLFSVPPSVVACFLSLATSYISDRYGARGFILIFSNVLSAVGFAVFLRSTSNRVQYGSLFMTVSGIWCASPAILTWSSNNVAPYTRRATATALAFVTMDCGRFLGTWLLGKLSSPPRYTGATITLLIFCVLTVVLAGMNIAYLTRQNGKKEAIRVGGSPENEKKGLGDRSAWFVYSL